MRTSNAVPVSTARLRLRPWTPLDQEPFRQMNADRRVMEYFPALLSDAESDALVDRICIHHQSHGFGLWAVELCATSTFIGFTGLAVPQWNAPFAPCVEISWRLAHPYWGKGYATEAAQAALAFGFGELKLDEIVSFTVAENDRSQRVMQRLRMLRSEKEDFYHPALPCMHPLSRHVLYRLSREAWNETSNGRES